MNDTEHRELLFKQHEKAHDARREQATRERRMRRYHYCRSNPMFGNRSLYWYEMDHPRRRFF